MPGERFAQLGSSCRGETPSARTRGEGEARNGMTESRQGHHAWDQHGMDHQSVELSWHGITHISNSPVLPRLPIISKNSSNTKAGLS